MTTMPPEAARSCVDCPGCMTSDKVMQVYASSFGADTDICGTFGHVLSNPNQASSVNLKIKRKMANGCEKYGVNTSPMAVPTALVAIPDSSAIPTSGSLATCTACKNYVAPSTVQREFGWNAGLCAATGRLLMPSRLTQEPKTCGKAAFGENRSSTNGLVVSPMLDPEFLIDVDEIATAIVAEDFIEPLEYVTDRKVTDADRAEGILSWRKIMHPKYGDLKPAIWLPIMDPESYTEAERAMIPQTDDPEHPELYVDHQGLVYKVLVAMLGMDKAPVLNGEAGTGKTECFRHLAWMTQMPFVRISLNKNSEVDDLIGKWLFEDGQTVWHNGRLATAWGKPYVICLDEWNTPPDAVMQFLRPLTDNSKQLVVDAGKGARINRHDFCLLGMAQNPSWDLKNIGTNQLSDADESRCAWIAVDMPSEEIERSIIVRHCLADGYEIEAKTLDAIMEIAKDIRQLTDPRKPSLSFSWGIRPQLSVASATKYLSLMEAYKIAIIDRLDPAQADTITNFVTVFES
jgi:MoxR-like ATPase